MASVSISKNQKNKQSEIIRCEMIWNRFASLTILCEILFFFSQLNVVSISLCVKILQESGEITCHGMDFDDILTSSDKICGADKILIANASAIYSSVCL